MPNYFLSWLKPVYWSKEETHGWEVRSSKPELETKYVIFHV